MWPNRGLRGLRGRHAQNSEGAAYTGHILRSAWGPMADCCAFRTKRNDRLAVRSRLGEARVNEQGGLMQDHEPPRVRDRTPGGSSLRNNRYYEIIAVMRAAGAGPFGLRLRALIVILWRSGLVESATIGPSARTDREGFERALVRAGRVGRGAKSAMDEGLGSTGDRLQFRLTPRLHPSICVSAIREPVRPWNFTRSPTSLAYLKSLSPDENFEVLTRLVDQLRERGKVFARSAPARTQHLEVAADARRESRGTVGLRLVPTVSAAAALSR